MTLNILVVEELILGEPLADMLKGQGYTVDLGETDEDVDRLRRDADRLKRYGLLIIEPFEIGKYSFEREFWGGCQEESPRVQLIRSFEGKKYITTTANAGIRRDDVFALFGLEKGRDYSRIYVKPYSIIQLANDIAADFGLPARIIDFDKPCEP